VSTSGAMSVTAPSSETAAVSPQQSRHASANSPLRRPRAARSSEAAARSASPACSAKRGSQTAAMRNAVRGRSSLRLVVSTLNS